MAKTIEDYKKENAEHQAEIKSLNAKIADTGNTVEIEEHKNALVNANAEIATLKEKAANAELRLAEYEAAGLKTGVVLTNVMPKNVKIGDKKYRFTVPRFSHGSVVMTAAEAALDEEILGQLVAIDGQGLLQEIK